MPTPPKDPAIYIGDTVHTIARDGTENRARWEVEEIHPDKGTAQISRSTTTGHNSHHYRSMPFDAARLALVRHGTALDDDMRKLGIEPNQKPHHSDRRLSPYILDGRAHPPEGRP